MSDAAGQIDKDHAAYGAKRLADGGFTDWEVVVVKSNQLQIDYDVPEIPEHFLEVLKLLSIRFQDSLQELTYQVFDSKSGKNKHVVINCPDKLEDVERVAWQAVFGSDRTREGLSLLSVHRKEKNPILLFMRKDRTNSPVTVLKEETEGRKFREE